MQRAVPQIACTVDGFVNYGGENIYALGPPVVWPKRGGGLGVANHTYGRFAWDSRHGVFLVVDNFGIGTPWQVWAVRP